MSKGDTPRPVDRQKYGKNYDRIFRKSTPDELKHYRPINHMSTPDCGWPFCGCKKECEKGEQQCKPRS